MVRKKSLALVLAGGAARGAYEVGVVDHVVREVARDTGREIRFDILCGTSVGALNACGLGAYAHEGKDAARRLVDIWTSLEVSELVSPDVSGVLGMGARLLGRSKADKESVAAREGGILHASGLERLVETRIPFPSIKSNLEKGHLDALTVSTTHVASGKTVVFIQTKDGAIPAWSLDPTVIPRAEVITARHALASAAIPILFRAVQLNGEYHCDGGLRQNVPLSPARRLGADGLIVINPRHIDEQGLSGSPATEEEFPGPFFLLGKTLNALLLDRIDTDLARLESINRILDAGTRAYGPGFVDSLNAQLRLAKPSSHLLSCAAGDDKSKAPPGRGMRPLRAVLVRSTEDIGKMAAEFVHSASFARVGGILGRVMRALADPGAKNESDLLSYLLFDGEFAGRLIEIGRRDARARHDELCAFIERLYADD